MQRAFKIFLSKFAFAKFKKIFYMLHVMALLITKLKINIEHQYFSFKFHDSLAFHIYYF